VISWLELHLAQLDTWVDHHSQAQWRYADESVRYWHWGSAETPVSTSLELMSYIRYGQWITK